MNILFAAIKAWISVAKNVIFSLFAHLMLRVKDVVSGDTAKCS